MKRRYSGLSVIHVSDQSIQLHVWNLGQQRWHLKKALVQTMPKCCYMYARPVGGGNEPNLHLQLLLFVYLMFHAYVWSDLCELSCLQLSYTGPELLKLPFRVYTTMTKQF